MIKTLPEHYQSVIDDVAFDILRLQINGTETDQIVIKLLQKRQLWLIQRKKNLSNRNDTALTSLKKRLEKYLSLCNDFWKDNCANVHEGRLDVLFSLTNEATTVHSLTGYNACFALFGMLKRLRQLVPPPRYDDHHKAILSEMEGIKSDCMVQIRKYIKPLNPTL